MDLGFFRFVYIFDLGFGRESQLRFWQRVATLNINIFVVGYASDVCGKRFVGGCMRRGSEW